MDVTGLHEASSMGCGGSACGARLQALVMKLACGMAALVAAGCHSLTACGAATDLQSGCHQPGRSPNSTHSVLTAELSARCTVKW